MSDALYFERIQTLETIVTGELRTGKLKNTFARYAELDMLSLQELKDLLNDLQLNEEMQNATS